MNFSLEMNIRVHYHSASRLPLLKSRNVPFISPFDLSKPDLLLYAGGAWYDTNAQHEKDPNRRTSFPAKAFCVYEVELLRRLKGFMTAISDQCVNLFLLDDKVFILVASKKRARKMLMSHLRMSRADWPKERARDGWSEKEVHVRRQKESPEGLLTAWAPKSGRKCFASYNEVQNKKGSQLISVGSGDEHIVRFVSGVQNHRKTASYCFDSTENNRGTLKTKWQKVSFSKTDSTETIETQECGFKWTNKTGWKTEQEKNVWSKYS